MHARRFEKTFYFSTDTFNLELLETIKGRDNKLAAECIVDFFTRNPELQQAGVFVVEVFENLIKGCDYNVYLKVA